MFKRLKSVGPGAMVAAAFIGPGTVTTATIAGASYGYTLLWAIIFSILATYLLQEMSARLGVIGKMGIGEAIRQKVNHRIFKVFAFTLVFGAIFVGNAAYEAGNITGAVLGFENYFDASGYIVNPLILLIGIIAFALLFSGRYKLIERSLIIMVSVMGFVFLLSAIMLKPDMMSILKGCFTPELPRGGLIMVVGLIGTTVVPYNLFLHASSVKQRWSGPEDLKISKWGTLISVILGGLITMSILITSAIAFEGQNKVVNGAADLAEQLTPLLGDWSGLFIAFGFLAAGLSSAVTAPLAAGYATSELMDWKGGLKGRNFRFIWIAVLLIGIVFSSLGIRPTSVILFAQVANGLLLPIIATFVLWIMNDKQIMGEYVNSKLTNSLGILVILVTVVLGLKGIMSAIGIL
jgi:Mn2+/Fe2+ NRAMP family transporter